MSARTLTTDRLILRPWRESDREPWAAINADPRVREHFPSLLTRQESDASLDRMSAALNRDGYGWWAVEVRDGPEFIGTVALTGIPFSLPNMPVNEVGWRLAFEAWGKGYATEAAREALRFGFEELKLPEVVAFTVPANTRSRNVMEKLGMTYDPADDFDHPRIAQGHPLRRHVLYRLRPA